MWNSTHFENVFSEAPLSSPQSEHILDAKQLAFPLLVSLHAHKIPPRILCAYCYIVNLLKSDVTTLLVLQDYKLFFLLVFLQILSLPCNIKKKYDISQGAKHQTHNLLVDLPQVDIFFNCSRTDQPEHTHISTLADAIRSKKKSKIHSGQQTFQLLRKYDTKHSLFPDQSIWNAKSL